jgi:hypothetical protein
MPRSHTSLMDQKTQFIADYLRRTLSITEVCDLYGVSRPNQTPEPIVRASVMPPGALRSCWRSWRSAMRPGPGRRALPCATSCAATAGRPSGASGVTLATPANPRP